MSERIGGKEISAMSRDELESALRERLRVNVGLLAENTEMKRKVAGLESGEADEYDGTADLV